MKKTLKNAAIHNVYKTLDKANSVKDSATRRVGFKAMFPMKKIAEECEDYQREAAKRLQPDNYQSVVDIINEFNAMSPTEREDALKQPRYMDALRANFSFNKDLERCVTEYMGKESEIDFAPLTDEMFDALCDANPDWTLGQCIELQDALCEKGCEA